jgi:transketolase
MASVILEPAQPAESMRAAYGDALVELGRARPDVVGLSADVQSSDFSFRFEQVFPERFFNVGIAEPALVDVAVGLANAGLIPIANTFAFLFVTRALEMVRTHLCYGGANVKLAAAYAGLSDSFDGPTHQTISDLAVLRSLPRIAIVVPADARAVRRLLPKVVAWNGPVYFRLCRNEVPQIFSEAYDPEIGRGMVLREGADATVIACGIMVSRALAAAEQLRAEGIAVRVVEMHTIKPLDTDLIERCAVETGAIVTAEEHSVLGGLGGAVSECIAETSPVPVERVGLRDTFAESGPYQELLEKYGLTAAAIVKALRRALDRRGTERRSRNAGTSVRDVAEARLAAK